MKFLALPAVLLLVGCDITDPCQPETRYTAEYQQWRVVCLEPQNNAQVCVVWPQGAPDWLGDPAQMLRHGVPLRPEIVCHETPITDTPSKP